MCIFELIICIAHWKMDRHECVMCRRKKMFECWFQMYVILLFVRVYKLLFVRFIDIKTTRNIFLKDQKSHKIWRALFIRSFVVCFGEFLFSWIVIVSEHARFYFHFISFHWKDNGVYAFWLNWKHTRTQSQVTYVIDNFRLSHIIKTHTHAYAHAHANTQTQRQMQTYTHFIIFVSFLFLSFFFNQFQKSCNELGVHLQHYFSLILSFRNLLFF